MPKTLADLLASLPQTAHITGRAETLITAPIVESDAELQRGGVFVARKGLSVDGHQFIPRAIERGAAAVVGEQPITPLSVPYVQVENAQEAVGYLAAAYQNFPSRKLTVIGVTGTDGKTTTCTLIHSILQQATDGKAGMISTIAAHIGDKTLETGLHVTTPSAPQIQALLAQMVTNGLTHAVLEMTSHGLAQGRLNGVDIDAAVLTNVTHEHLDYHGSFEAYRAAKGRMFEMLGTSYRKPHQPKIGVINADDPSAGYFAAFTADQHISYATRAKAKYKAADVLYRPGHTQFVLYVNGQPLSSPVYLPLVGGFNVLNALAATACTREHGVLFETIQKGLLNVSAISGRMERIDEGQEFLAIVDFAHTPNALKNALQACRPMVGRDGRLIAVFGSAGLRDREKRRLMAATSIKLADFTILTAEDPRAESLDDILTTMADAAAAAGGMEGRDFIRVPDRGEALYRACQMAKQGDVVIACGKGHEQSMAFGSVEYPWDDRDAMRAALRGEPLKTLPTAGKRRTEC